MSKDQNKKAADELKAAEVALEEAERIAATPKSVVDAAQTRVMFAREEAALEEVENYVKEHVDEIKAMLDSEAILWLKDNAPFGVIVKIVNTYRYAEMLSAELKRVREAQ